LSNFVKQSYLAIHAKQPIALHTSKKRRNIYLNNNPTDKLYQVV
jgi:hypothetical protein